MSRRRDDENTALAAGGSDSESDESEAEEDCAQPPAALDPVYLGFAGDVPIAAERAHALRCEYFPLGKVGGAPSWLTPAPLPDAEQLACLVCERRMRFVLQLYAPQDVERAFHRYVYVFACDSGQCSQPNNADNLRVLRCQLPKKNAFYGDSGPLDAEADAPIAWLVKDAAPKAAEHDGGDCDGDSAAESPPAVAWPRCAVCGCHGPSRCGRCNAARYCGREHQAWHWKHGGHRQLCDAAHTATADTCSGGPESSAWLWPCHELAMDEQEADVLAASLRAGRDDGDKTDEQRMAEFRQFVTAHEQQQQNGAATAAGAVSDRSNKTGGGDGDKDGPDVKAERPHKANRGDRVFDRFRAVLSAYDGQIVRYQLGGRPLCANSQPLSPPSACALCGAPRQFEFQLTPHLLSVLGVDAAAAPGEDTLDFATVLVYTCSQHCAVPHCAYAAEAAVKQDFDQ